MENASKALLIAGGMLITILILSLMTYIFSNIARNANSVYKDLDETSISEFNQVFLNFDGKGTTTDEDALKTQDVITIVNYARNNNKYNKMPVVVKVLVDEEDWTNKSEQDLNEILKKDINNTPKKYKCTEIKINEKSRLVEEVDIDTI